MCRVVALCLCLQFVLLMVMYYWQVSVKCLYVSCCSTMSTVRAANGDVLLASVSEMSVCVVL